MATNPLHKPESSNSQSNAQVTSSISNLSRSSNVLPHGKDFHFYYNFDEFRSPIDEIRSSSQFMLEQIGSSGQLWGGREMNFPSDVEEDGYDWLVNVNDEIIDRFDASIDEFSRLRKEQEDGARTRAGVRIDEDGFQLVCRKKKTMKEKEESVAPMPAVSVSERDKKVVGSKPKVPFHIRTIKRPQDEYKILVNNANEPFQHVWIDRSEDGSRVVHPLEKLSIPDFVDANIEGFVPQNPSPLESTPCKLVEEVQDLKELVSKLRSVNEFAVDLEHNHYRSFQGLTCLMQISTRTEDFIVDTLKLRIHVGPYLRDIFKDPTKRKVMHGADKDIVWLQRDFGIYVCNLFDTGQASRVLQMERNSLEHLLQHFCGVTANKEYQKADWRLRPLPDEMIRYAREDTHYLLYIYDLMKIRLLSESTVPENSDSLLLEVYKHSSDVCMQLYEKELLTDTSYLYIYGVQGANLNAQQLSIVAGLCEWRDAIARAEDESTGYVLPNKALLEIAKHMPLTTSKLRRLVRSKHPYVERNLSSIVDIIKLSVQNASAFEAVAEQLKEVRIQSPELNDAGADLSEVHAAGVNCGEGSVGSLHEHVPDQFLPYEEIGPHASHDLNIPKDRSGVSFEDIGNGLVKKDVLSNISDETQRESISFPVQKKETNATGMHSEKVAEATVQVLKKPNRGFGALLGSSVAKKKTDLEKEKVDKLELIKSSVNLPFYTFSHGDQQSKQSTKLASEEPNGVGTLVSGNCPMAPPICSNSEDIVLLDGDRSLTRAPEEPKTLANSLLDAGTTEPAPIAKSDDIIFLDSGFISNDEAVPDSSAGDDNHLTMKDQENFQSKLATADGDDEDEPMSLSDLSSNFQKCLESANQNQPVKKDKKSEKNVCVQFKPFDYETARKEVKFGIDAKREVTLGDGKNSGDKKGGGADKIQQDGNVLPQGKRRQAFPASGNRSATFR